MHKNVNDDPAVTPYRQLVFDDQHSVRSPIVHRFWPPHILAVDPTVHLSKRPIHWGVKPRFIVATELGGGGKDRLQPLIVKLPRQTS